MSFDTTDILGLPIYNNLDDIDYNELNVANQQLDRLPPTQCTAATRPATDLFTGRIIYETDTDRLYMWDGDSWTLLTDKASSSWTDFAGTIKVWDHMTTTPVEVTAKAVGMARYRLAGKTVWAQCDITITATTTGGVAVDLPFTARNRVTCGIAGLFGATTPADQSGLAHMSSGKDKILIVAYSNGFRDTTNPNVFRYSVCYELP